MRTAAAFVAWFAVLAVVSMATLHEAGTALALPTALAGVAVVLAMLRLTR